MKTFFSASILFVVFLTALSLVTATRQRSASNTKAQCVPTPNHSTPGPVYKPAAKLKDGVVCDVSTRNSLPFKIDERFCSHRFSSCWRRARSDEACSRRLFVSGSVRLAGSCEAIPHAILDLWQTDLLGKYGSLQPEEEEGFCRALIQADKHGHYEFETDNPGVYGTLNGAFESFDLPPYLPRHIHVLVYANATRIDELPAVPDLLATQLYFKDDPIRKYDWRESLMEGIHLYADANITALDPKPCTHKGQAMDCVSFDFVLAPSRDPKEASLPIDEQLIKRFCSGGFQLGGPLPLCYPRLTRLVRWYVLVPFLLAVLVGFALAVRTVLRLLCGRGGAKRKAD